jgi:hypothetical protein
MSVSTTSVAQAVGARHTPAERLFQPMRLGRYHPPHRMVMAPLTRSRARQPGNVPSALNACYYAQQASAALIVTDTSPRSSVTAGSLISTSSTRLSPRSSKRPNPTLAHGANNPNPAWTTDGDNAGTRPSWELANRMLARCGPKLGGVTSTGTLKEGFSHGY